MSPAEAKALLTAANAAVAAGDHEGFLACCTDDTVWTFVGDRVLRGKEAVRAWLNESYVEPPRNTVQQLVADGEMLVAVGEITTKDAAGKETRAAYADVWRIRDGLLAELKAFVGEGGQG